jgi:virginiamycin B lyase
VGLKRLVIGAALLAAVAPAESLPEGPGKALVEAICTSCHSADRILDKQRTRPQWEATVLEMLQEEPDVTQSERDKIVDYLAKTFPVKAKVSKSLP